MDVAIVAVQSELDNISLLKEELRHTLKAFRGGKDVSAHLSNSPTGPTSSGLA